MTTGRGIGVTVTVNLWRRRLLLRVLLCAVSSTTTWAVTAAVIGDLPVMTGVSLVTLGACSIAWAFLQLAELQETEERLVREVIARIDETFHREAS